MWPGVNCGLKFWLPYNVEIWACVIQPYNPLSFINFNKTRASVTEQIIKSALGKDFSICPNLPILGTGIPFMRAPVLGIRGEEASNPSLTADLCEQKRLGERDTFGLCVSEPYFLVRRDHNVLWTFMLLKATVFYLKERRITWVENVSSDTLVQFFPLLSKSKILNTYIKTKHLQGVSSFSQHLISSYKHHQVNTIILEWGLTINPQLTYHNLLKSILIKRQEKLFWWVRTMALLLSDSSSSLCAAVKPSGCLL